MLSTNLTYVCVYVLYTCISCLAAMSHSSPRDGDVDTNCASFGSHFDRTSCSFGFYQGLTYKDRRVKSKQCVYIYIYIPRLPIWVIIVLSWYIYICLYICTHVYIYVYTSVYICVIHIYIYMYIYIYRCTCVN